MTGSNSASIRLVVLFGGRSAEHEVSCMSALNVLGALDRDRYDVAAVGITREGRWVDATLVAESLDPRARALPSPDGAAPEATVEPLAVIGGDDRQVVVLPLVHGPMGEDGTVQGLLEVAGVPYVGAGVLASALCMDKGAAKDVLAARGLPQARYATLRRPEATPARLQDEAARLGWPLYVKPANMGSSVGVSRATDPGTLAAALELAWRYDEYVVLEEQVVGREIEVAVLGDLEPRASVPGEIRPDADFYDFDDKYVHGTAELLVPAPLDDAATDEVRRLAVEVYRALRVDGMARVDFFYEERARDGSPGRGFLVNELNTLPGFTHISMYPRLWGATGLPYGRLVDELVQLALERHERRAGFDTTRLAPVGPPPGDTPPGDATTNAEDRPATGGEGER